MHEPGHDRTLDFDGDGEDLALQASLQPQAARKPTVPGYELDQLLGQGTFGEVWSGIQISTGQKVAVKTLHRADLGAVSYLQKEVSRLVELSEHPNILSLIDARFDTQPAFIVTPRLQESLEQYTQSSLKISTVCQWMEEVAQALRFIHQRGILHCDLKPANLLLDQEGRVRVVDFGQAHLLDHTGISLGTLWFMPPEQIPREGHPPQPEVAWDLYAWGATAYCLLTGALPRQTAQADAKIDSLGDTKSQLQMYRDLLKSQPLRPIRSASPKVDRDFSAIVEKALALNAEERYGSASELLDDLRRRRQWRPVLARQHSINYRTRRFFQRNWIFTIFLGLALVGLGFSVEKMRRDRALIARYSTESLLGQAKELQDQGNLKAPLMYAQAVFENPDSHAARLQAGSSLPSWVQGKWQLAVGTRQAVCTPNQEYLLLDPHDATLVKAYSHQTGKWLRDIKFNFPIANLKLSPSQKHLMVSDLTGRIACLEVDSTSAQPLMLPTFPSRVMSSWVSAAGDEFAVGLESCELFHWKKGQESSHWVHPAPVSLLLVDQASGHLMALGGTAVALHDFRSGKTLSSYSAQQPVVTAAWAQPGKSCWLGFAGGGLHQWGLNGVVSTLTHGTHLTGLHRLGDGRVLSWGGPICRLWSGEGQLLQEYVDNADIELADASEDGRFAVTGSSDNRIRVWDQKSGRPLALPLARQSRLTNLTLLTGRPEFFVVAGAVESWSFEGVQAPSTALGKTDFRPLQQAVWGWGAKAQWLATCREGLIEFWTPEGQTAAQSINAAEKYRARWLKLGPGPQGKVLAYLGRLNQVTALLLDLPPVSTNTAASLPLVVVEKEWALETPLWTSPQAKMACHYSPKADRLEVWDLQAKIEGNDAPKPLWCIPCSKRVPLNVSLLDDGQQLAAVFKVPTATLNQVGWYAQAGQTFKTIQEHNTGSVLQLRVTPQGLLQVTPTTCQLLGPNAPLWSHRYPGHPVIAMEEPQDKQEWRDAQCDPQGKSVLCLGIRQFQWYDVATGGTRISTRQGRNFVGVLNDDGTMVCILNGTRSSLFDLSGPLGPVPFSDALYCLGGSFRPDGKSICLWQQHSLSLHPLLLDLRAPKEEYLYFAQLKTQRLLGENILHRLSDANVERLRANPKKYQREVLR